MKNIIILISVSFLCSCANTTSTTMTPLNRDQSCKEGSTRQGYISPSTTGDLNCPTGVQTCVSGLWTGPTIFDACSSYTKSCGGSAHGTMITGYIQPTTTKGVPCVPASKTCVNGNWMGPEVFMSCSEI